MDSQIITSIITIITAMGGILAVYLEGVRNKHDAVRMINETYSELCEQLQTRIKALHEDIVRAENRIAVLERENGELRKALEEAVKAKERLQVEVDELSERLAAYENKPTRARASKCA